MFLRRIVLVGCLLLWGGVARAGEKQALRIANHDNGSTVRYPVVLLRGSITDKALTSITVTNESSKRPSRELTGQAYQGGFKVLCELVPGENNLVLQAGKATKRLKINYKPATNSHVVRMIYMTDNTGKTAYQSPFADDPKDFADKLDTAMKLMQTFTAERMYDLGFGHRTFHPEYDADGKVKVHIHKGKQTAEEYYALNDQVWWRNVGAEVEKTYPTKKGKNIVIAAYTRYDPKTKKKLGHTALGGGGLGLFGSGNLFTWPTTLADVPKAFLEAKRIDTDKFMDDSAFRGTFWAAASTTIGATLHEMGHTFGLPHTNHPRDIMTRGFDQFNRAFTLTEPGGKGNATFPEDRIACFAPISAAALVSSPWFADDDRPRLAKNTVQIKYDAKAETFTATSDAGMRYLGANEKGDMKAFAAPPALEKAPAQWTLTLAEVRKTIKGNDFSITAIDDDGFRRSVRWQDVKPKEEPMVAHRVLVADYSKKRIAIVDAKGKIEWQLKIADIHDLHMLPNGNVLFQTSWTRLVEMDPRTNQLVWQYDAKTSNGNEGKPLEVHAFQRLADGVTMIAESGPARIIEIDRDGKLLREIKLQVGKPHPHRDTRLVRKLESGNYLVCHEGLGMVREYDGTGKIVWEYEVPLFDQKPRGGHGVEAWGNSCFAAVRLGNGNTLISTGNGHSVIEVTSDKKIAWHLKQDDLPGIKLAWVTTLQVLANGNIVLGNCHAGPKNPQIIEITREKRVVWTFHDFTNFGDATSNSQVLDVKGSLR